PICASTLGKSGSTLMPGSLSGPNGVQFGTIGGATCDWNGANNNDVWIKFTPTSSNVCISISGLDFNLQSVIVTDANADGDNDPCTYTGAFPNPAGNDPRWTLVSCPNNAIYSGTSGTQLNQQHCFTAVVGKSYYLVVDGTGGIESPFFIQGVSGLPDIDIPPACQADITISENSGIPNDGMICSGETATLTATGGGTYLWSTGAATPSIIVSTSGTYTVTVTVGTCTATATKTITVKSLPSVTEIHSSPTCPGGNDGTINLTLTGNNPFTFNWNTPNGSGLINGNEDQFSLTSGTYNVTVTDKNSCKQSISVILPSGIDMIPPNITCPTDITIQCNASILPANTGSPIVSDNCSGNITTSYTDITNFNGCGGYTGSITRTWRATDSSNNSKTCIQTITVRDNIPPVALCKDITVSLDGNGDASITAAQINNGSNDQCTPQGNLILSVNPSSFTCINKGMNNVTLTVTDACNNSSQCVAKVTVQDNSAPSIVCPPDITIQCNQSILPATTGTATGSDNCSGLSIT
ncbi:MAG: hypothetical protein WAT37_14895, partial [Saprospiraceae bacterium]